MILDFFAPQRLKDVWTRKALCSTEHSVHKSSFGPLAFIEKPLTVTTVYSNERKNDVFPNICM